METLLANSTNACSVLQQTLANDVPGNYTWQYTYVWQCSLQPVTVAGITVVTLKCHEGWTSKNWGWLCIWGFPSGTTLCSEIHCRQAGV